MIISGDDNSPQRQQKSVDIFPGRLGRNVAAAGNHKVRELSAGFQQLLCHPGNGFRCAAPELGSRADIAHHQRIGRGLGQDIHQVDGIAKVIAQRPQSVDVLKHQGHIVAAIMIDHAEIITLYPFDELPRVGMGKLSGQRRRQQPGKGLRHHNAVRPGSPEGVAIRRQKRRTLFQNGVHHVRLIITVDHGLADIHQPAGKRIGADDACQNRPVGNGLGGFSDGFHTDAGASGPHLRHRQGLRLRFLRHQRSHHRGHFVPADMDGAAEGLGLHRQIH